VQVCSVGGERYLNFSNSGSIVFGFLGFWVFMVVVFEAGWVFLCGWYDMILCPDFFPFSCFGVCGRVLV